MENNLLKIGDKYSLSFSYSQNDVELFAKVTGDSNPIHLNETYASKTIFNKPIIHGFLGGSIFSRVLGTSFPGEGTLYLNQTLTFRKPMFVEITYLALIEVIHIDREKHRATVLTRVQNSLGEDIIVGEALIMNKNCI